MFVTATKITMAQFCSQHFIAVINYVGWHHSVATLYSSEYFYSGRFLFQNVSKSISNAMNRITVLNGKSMSPYKHTVSCPWVTSITTHKQDSLYPCFPSSSLIELQIVNIESTC